MVAAPTGPWQATRNRLIGPNGGVRYGIRRSTVSSMRLATGRGEGVAITGTQTLPTRPKRDLAHSVAKG